MKNSLVRLSFLVGLVLISGLAANAQTSTSYRANVPFSFEADGKNYANGVYSIRSLGTGSAIGAVTLEDRKTGRMKVLGLTSASGTNRDIKGKLIFIKTNSSYVLSRIETPDFVLKVRLAHSERWLAKNGDAKGGIVEVTLD